MAELTPQQQQLVLEQEIAAINSQRAQQKLNNTLQESTRIIGAQTDARLNEFRREIAGIVEEIAASFQERITKLEQIVAGTQAGTPTDSAEESSRSNRKK